MTMGLEPKWTDINNMLATCTDDQLLKWKEVAENPRVDNYRSITTLRQLVVDLYNKSIKDIIDELSIAIDDEINSRKESINTGMKYEYHKEYSEAAYKDRVYKWFNDNASTLDDVDLQKFVDLCIRGNLTFQCADEVDIDDPDISMIDHLLMDIASEKNDELINTYTDEIDWDNDYVEKYNSDSSMDKKKLEKRIARLERLLAIKNENMELDNLAKRLEILFNKRRVSAEVKAYSDDVTVIFDWEPDPGYFTVKPSEDGGYEVEDEYYTEKFDTIQQVIDYLVKKDNDNVR